ncbi:MAG: phosphohistidine phosphatase SixA [Methanomicrobiaceae archaeon]|nr:phosphohistidine phosphatase SixA [Methanomicrobiaceae archaeon]
MDLYILRHGKAALHVADPVQDAARPLTRAGAKEMQSIARWIAARGIAFDLVVTSPLPRARETAEIVARACGIEDRLVEWIELAQGHDPGTVVAKLQDECEREACPSTVMIVGHEPGLSILISHIVAGHNEAGIVLKKGGVARIRDVAISPAVRGELTWLLTPGMMRGG